MHPSDKAWIVLGAGVLAWDISCSDGDTLSEACDRYMLRHPWLVRGLSFALAAHVCNLVKPSCDPIHWAFRLTRLVRPQPRGTSCPT